MTSPEQESQLNPESYLESILAWRPPLPVGQVDVSDIAELSTRAPAAAAPGYAWERLPRWLTEIEDTFKKPGEVPIVCLDLCSSLPLYAQLMRAMELRRAGERARELARNLFSNGSFQQITDSIFRSIHEAASRSQPGRRLLDSAVQTVLYTLNSEDTPSGDQAESIRQLTERFFNQLTVQRDTYLQDKSASDIETGWGLKFKATPEADSYQKTLSDLDCRTSGSFMGAEMLKTDPENENEAVVKFYRELASRKMKIGEERAKAYIEWQAAALAQMVAGNNRYRPARFISMDWTPPVDIAASSLINAPDSTRKLNLFSHALRSLFDPYQHIVGDIFEPLPVPDNSLTLITCYDAWPFDTSLEGKKDEEVAAFAEGALRTLFGYYKKLTYGGKLVIFPWATRDTLDRSASILRTITADLSLLTGHAVNRPIFHRATLGEFMSESDRVTAETLSGIFTADNEEFEAFIVEKPSRKLVEQHARTLGKRLINAGQTPDWPDPTP